MKTSKTTLKSSHFFFYKPRLTKPISIGAEREDVCLPPFFIWLSLKIRKERKIKTLNRKSRESTPKSVEWN